MSSIVPRRYRESGGSKLHEKDIIDLESAYLDSGWGIPKYLQFIRKVHELGGFGIKLHDSKSTVSKYVTCYRGRKVFKVRWSDHKPNFRKEVRKDCDFFVGVTNLTVTNTDMAYDALLKHFEIEK